jgi:phage FluMu protein Com
MYQDGVKKVPDIRKITCLNCGRILFESPSAVLAMTCPRCKTRWGIEVKTDGTIRYKEQRDVDSEWSVEKQA